MRKLRLVAAVSLALATSGAFALGLGDIEMRSALNQPMNAEIRLTSVEPGELDGMIVKLASQEAFDQAGIERSEVLTGLRFRVDQSGAAPVIRITSNSPVVEPFLNFLIEIDWPQGRMVREYTVLLDPPVFLTPSASGSSALDDAASLGGRGEGALVAPAPIEREAPVAGTDGLLVDRLGESDSAGAAAELGEDVSLDGLLDSDTVPAGEVVSLSDLGQPNTAARPALDVDVELVGDAQEVGDQVAEDARAGAVVESPGEIVSLEELASAPVDATRGDAPRVAERPVSEGDTLFRIAEGLTDDGTSVEQTMLALLAANESAFINGNINLVRAGSILRVPEASEARRLSRTQAAAEVTKQARLWEEYRDSRRGASGTRLAANPSDAGTSAGSSAAGTDASGADDSAEPTEALSASAQAFLDEAAEEVRSERLERERLRIVGDDTTSDGADATADNTDRLDNIEQRLQLAREQLASSRQEAGDLGDQASELRSTTENFDALIALRQNEIAALEARLGDARAQAEQEAEKAAADEASEAASQLARNATDSVAGAGDAVGDALGESAEGAAGAVGDTLQAGADGVGAAADAAERSARNALTDAGQALDSVELVGDDTPGASAEQGSDAAIGGDADAAITATAPADAAQPWYQTLLGDPTRLAIAGVGGLALFGALGTLLWRRRRGDDEDAWLEGEEEVEFLDGDAAAADVAGGVAAEASARDQAASAFDDPFDKDASLDGTLAGGDDPALQTSDQTASELGGLSEGALDKDDTISEVDVYLAYGLHGQAEELLTRAIDRDPNNPVYARKLLDTYHAQGNAEGFEGAAAAWQARFGGTGHPEWPEIAAMGQELRPDSAMFASSEGGGGSGSTGVLAGVAAGAAGAAAFAGAGMGSPDSGADATYVGDDAAAAGGAHGADETYVSGNDLTGAPDVESVSFEDDLAVSLDGDESELMDQSLDPAFAFDVGDLEATGDFSSMADEIALETGGDSIEFDADDAGDAAAPVLDAAAARAPGAASSMTGIEAPELAGMAASAVPPMPDVAVPNAAAVEPHAANLASDLTLDLDQLSEELELDGTEMLEIPDLTADNDLLIDDGELAADADEVDTMMDLAKAYIDMGDRDSASSTLDEIVKSGNPDQVTEAETLLRKIS